MKLNPTILVRVGYVFVRLPLLISILFSLPCGSDADVTLRETWQEGELYNENVGYCAIQQELPDAMYGYLVIKDGKIVAEGYGDGKRASDFNFIYSVTKSWSSMLVGVCVRNGLIRIEDKLGEIFDFDNDWVEVEDAEYKKAIPLHEILSMSSGLVDTIEFDPSQLDDNQQSLSEVLNSVRFVPEERGNFNYVATNQILARIIERVSGGLTPLEFAIESGTFDAMGVTDYEWLTFGGVEGSAYGLKMNPRTMAKLGQLYLQNGFAAEGVPVVDSSWIEISRTNQLPRGSVSNWPVFRGYGYQWYTDLDPFDDANPTELKGSYTAVGYGGQYVTVFPEDKAVAVIAMDPAQTRIARILEAGRARFLLPIAQNLKNFDEPVNECLPRGLLPRAFDGVANIFFELRVLASSQFRVFADSTARFFGR